MAAAVQFNEKFASNYVAAPIAAPAAGSWVSVSGTFTGKLAAQQPPGEAHRLFVLSVPYDPAVDSYLVPGAEVRFPIVPGAEANSVVCTLPLVDKWPSSKCAFTFPVKLSKEGATSDVVTINGMEVRAPAAEGEAGEEEAAAEEEGGGDDTLVDAPAEEEAGAAAEGEAGAAAGEEAVHVPVPSQFGTPVLVADIHARLCVEPKLCAENGDCFPLSSMCGFELTADKVEAPDADTTEAVRVSRDASVGILVGDDPIGGIAASTLRKEEGMEEATFREKMAPWRSSYHWATAEAKLSAAFMFSLAVHLERTVIVLETTPDGEKYIDPARAYGMRDDSELRRTPERRGKEETIPFYFMIKLADLPTVLRAQACSLLQYDRDGVHFQPLVRDIAWTEEQSEKGESEGEEGAAVSLPADDGAGTAGDGISPALAGDEDDGVDMEVHETPPLEQGQHLPQPMAPLRATQTATAKSLSTTDAVVADVMVVAEVAEATSVDAVAEAEPPAKRPRRSWQSAGSATATRDVTQGGGVWASFTATLSNERVVAGAQVRFVKSGVAPQTFDVPSLPAGQEMTFPLRFADVAGESVAVMVEVKAAAQKPRKAGALVTSTSSAASATASVAVAVPVAAAAAPVAAAAAPVAAVAAPVAAPNRKKRAAAARAETALTDAAAQEGDDLTHAVKASTVAPVKEKSLEEAIPPVLSPIKEAPLEEALDGLFGRCVAYRWHVRVHNCSAPSKTHSLRK